MPRPLLAAMAALVPVIPAVAAPPDGVAVLVIEGKGFGHGVGMAQDGAYWMARGRSTTVQILSHFYPGTKLRRATGPVRVTVLLPPTPAATVILPGGGEVRTTQDGSGSPATRMRVPAGRNLHLSFDGSRYLAAIGPQALALGRVTLAAQELPISTSTSLATTTTSTAPPNLSSTTSSSTATTSTRPGSTTTAPTATASEFWSPTPLWVAPGGGQPIVVVDRNRRYRGNLQATAQGGPFRLVNHLDVEQYLRGMGEVRDPRWPAAALRAQAIAARTYALRAVAAGGDLCDDQRCQVYLGMQVEYGAMDKAVRDTQGQVLTFGPSLAATVYSANGGGFSASREEGFGPVGGEYPYLRPAPYPTGDPLPWIVRVAFSDVAARLAHPGPLTAIRVTAVGPSGRVLQVTLDGPQATTAVDGIRFDRTLGLRSTLFNVRAEWAAQAPPPLPPAEDAAVQALPEDAGLLGSVPAPPHLTGEGEAATGGAPSTPPPSRGGEGNDRLVVAALLGLFLASASLGQRIRSRRWWAR